MTSYLGECSRGVVLVNELQDPDQGSPNDDWMTKDGVSCVPGLERDTSLNIHLLDNNSDLLIHLRVEPGIVVDIGHVESLPSLGDVAGNPLAHREPRDGMFQGPGLDTSCT